MDIKLIKAARTFLRECDFAETAHDLRTKIRIVLKEDYFMDMYYNKTLGKYTYTRAKGDKRVIGWDNAPHHKHLENFPHHFHTVNGKLIPSPLSGDPETDVYIILDHINKFFVAAKHT
ncbi:MAG: hypothetical protein EF813_03685 [Methanosarcinales archaeon]|nr:MAG: hypothetical protein EF813_03685 [Methanosarcinales archaeon]